MTLIYKLCVFVALINASSCANWLTDIFRDTRVDQEPPKVDPTDPYYADTSSGGPGAPVYSPVPTKTNSIASDPADSGFSSGSSSLNDPVNVRISDVIASNVLTFAQQTTQLIGSASKNIVFSPLSLMSALALLMLGAKGKSYQELKQLFGIDYDNELAREVSQLHVQFGLMMNDLQKQDVRNISPKRGLDPWRYTVPMNSLRSKRKPGVPKPNEHIIRVANGLFTQTGYNLNPNYKQVAKMIYHTELLPLDFQRQPNPSRSKINQWVNQNTYGKIPHIIDAEIPRDTNVLLVSALYFKGFWENDFFQTATKTDYFYPNGEQGAPIEVTMMATGGTYPFYDAPEYGCRIIGMPYRGNLTTMYVIQPYHSTRSKLRQLQSSLDAYKIEDMISKMVKRSAIVAFPKMSLQHKLSMANILKGFGVTDIFTNGQSDLSLIGKDTQARKAPDARQLPVQPAQLARRSSFGDQTSLNLAALEAERLTSTVPGNNELYVGDILHKVVVDINEQGTEAAAATAAILRKSGPEITFRADTPFMFLIRHDPTKLIMFYGVINEPSVT